MFLIATMRSPEKEEDLTKLDITAGLTRLFPRALEHRVVLIRRKIAINTQEVDVVKVFRKCLFVVFGMRWSMAPYSPFKQLGI
jgi:hypothetical protein